MIYYVKLQETPWSQCHVLYLCFPPNDLFHYWFTIKKARNIQNYGQDFINHISPLMGDPFARIKYGTFM